MQNPEIKELIDAILFMQKQNDVLAQQIMLNNEEITVNMHQIDFLMKKGEKNGNTVRKVEQI